MTLLLQFLISDFNLLWSGLSMNAIRKKLKNYYSNYYANHFLRDFRYIYDDKSRFNDVLTAKKLTEKSNVKLRALQFLTKSNHDGRLGLLGGEITYFQSLEDFKEGDINKRYCDRLFFDFDVEDERVSKIKDDMKEALDNLKGKEQLKQLNMLKHDFQDLIFIDDLLAPTFKEASSLCQYLEGLGLKPYLVFSGSKGFHVNVFFKEMQLINLSQISKGLAMSYSKKLDLKFLDYAVFDKNRIHRRLQRCQYVRHSKTDLFTLPIPNVYDYDEALAIIEKNKRRPIQFNMEDYKAPIEFNEALGHMNDEFSKINARRQRDLEKANLERHRKYKKKYKGKNFKSLADINMIDLAKAYGLGGVSKGDRLIVKCPFHDDKRPSAVVFEKRFYCSTCGLTLNYYDFVSKMEGLSDKSEIMKKVHELID